MSLVFARIDLDEAARLHRGGLESEVGTVTPGKRADLVAVDGNPLQNITVLQDVQRIKLVLKGGDVCVDRRVE